MILEGEEENADFFADLEVFVDGVLTKVTTTNIVGAALYEFEAARNELLYGWVVLLIRVDLDQVFE